MDMYSRLVTKRNDGPELKECMESTVADLLSKPTDVEHPGMLLGNIQSGKTRAYTGIIALGLEKKYDVAIVLTKGTKALVKQTVQRLQAEYDEFIEEDLLRVFDVMEMPDDLTEFTIDLLKLVIVVKKEDDNIHKLVRLFFEVYPSLSKKNTFIVDDEADFVSIGYRSKKNAAGQKEFDINVISKQISDFRKRLSPSSDYLQVTATPYSLYLQPEHIVIRDVEFAPMKPMFTRLLPIHEHYIGSTYYFDDSKNNDSPAQFLFQSIAEAELITLSKTHGRILDNILRSPKIQSLRTAIATYLVGSCIRWIQSTRSGKINYKSSFIIHTETSKSKHENQAYLVTQLIDSFKAEGNLKTGWFKSLLLVSYENLKLSLSLTHFHLPEFEDVFEKACTYVRYVTIRKINSDNDILSLLNPSTGELRLESPLNIFIGGQILDRGITVQNLIGFFYGRNPKRMQQDTVMQHARIFGARSLEDMAVTRLYTTNRIHNSLRRMHESDAALRKVFEEGGSDQKVAFIQKASDGTIIPCSPNKILLSNTVTLRPGGTLPVYGFQTKSKSHIQSTVAIIKNKLSDLSSQYDKPFLISVATALDLVDMVFSTFEEAIEVYGCTCEEFKSAIQYASNSSKIPQLKGQLYLFSNYTPKKSSRYKDNQRGHMFNDVCYDGRTDAREAKAVAIDVPCLFLSLQLGAKDKNDWRDANFYWPVLFVQRNLITSIFTSETEEEEDIT